MAFHQILSLLCHLVSPEGILILSGLPSFPVLCGYGLISHAAELNAGGILHDLCGVALPTRSKCQQAITLNAVSFQEC